MVDFSADLPEVTEDWDQAAAATLVAIGARIRNRRVAHMLTLQELGELTGLSASMLSLVERGKTSPSIGTLVSIASALNVHMSDLVSDDGQGEPDPVSRSADQAVFKTPGGVLRRVLRDDRPRGIEVAINEYSPGGASADWALRHDGYEYGVVIDGRLRVQIGDESYELEPGDLISYPSTRPHRISNAGRKPARALWVNFHLGE
jgi:transcriptional regulator with XRE-family HTH domain